MADEQAEVVIVDDAGTEHHFPPGFDPKRAAAIVRGQSKPDMSKMPAMAPVSSHETPRSVFQQMADANAMTGKVTSSPDYVKGQADVIPQTLAGAAKGVASTVYHAGDLLRRGYNLVAPASMQADRIITRPDVQATITPTNPLQRLGFGAEQMAEAAVPLSKVAEASKGASLLSRAVREGATAAAVTGAQSGGDTGEMAKTAAVGTVLPFAGAAGRLAQRTASAAADEGVGGAVASMIRSAAPQDAKTMLVQALKPRATNTGFESSLARAVPEIKAAEDTIGKPIENVDDLLQATQAAKKTIRAQYDAIAGPKRAMGSTVDLAPVADAIDSSIPRKLQIENPDAADRLRNLAQVYRQRFSLDDAEQLLKETNAELDSFYNKYPPAQRRALASDPEAARLNAQAKALRSAIYSTLDAPGQGAAARELQQRYGALLDVEEEAYRRANVAKRQQPESLSEQIGKVRAAADMARGGWRVLHGDLSGAADIAAAHAGRAAASALKEQQTTDALIRRAFANVSDTPVPVAMPPQPQIRGLLGPGPIVTPPPADASFVRGVPAMASYSERPALPPARDVVTPPPPPDASFARGVPAQYAKRDIRALLTEPKKVFVAPAPETSGVRAVRAGSVVQRDPRSGRMRKIFTSDEK